MPRTAGAYYVGVREDTGKFQIRGTNLLTGRPLRLSPRINRLAEARKEAADLWREHLEEKRFGKKLGARPFDDAVILYLESDERSPTVERFLERALLCGLEGVPLAQIDQEKINEVRKRMMPPDVKPSTVTRALIVPVRAVMYFAADQGWCARPRFKTPKQPKGRTEFYMPEEVDKLLVAATRNFRPLLVFYLGTGARHSEALRLDWRDVDLAAATAMLRDPKNGIDRLAHLPPTVVAALSTLPRRTGAVFRRPGGKPYEVYTRSEIAGHKTEQVGGIERALENAIRRSGVRRLTPHHLRHTWATWHYALNRDLLALKVEGGWSSVGLVERYAHLMPKGHEDAIRAFLHSRYTSLVQASSNELISQEVFR